MLPDLTPAVARALQAAQHLALLQGAADVSAADLLAGLLEEEEGRAADLLSRARLDLAAYRRASARPAGSPRPTETPLPLSPEARRVFDTARELAADLAAERTVHSEHLLLALVRTAQALTRTLETFGLGVAALEAELAPAQGAALALEEPLHLDGPTERIDAARIVDAGANRAREALRVLEDYCRFVLDDAFLTGELKRLRHDLAAALSALPSQLLLESRDTLRDVGTGLSTPREHQRLSLREVVEANCKRLQEALRSLEEYGKLHGSDLGRSLEQLRYRGYTLERALLLGSTTRQRLAEARLYVLVSGAGCSAALDWTIAEAVAGGASVIQLREKDLSDRELLERARQVRRWTRQAGVLFIVNDRPDIARLVEADGVHVGQDDLPVREVRRIVGPDALIGVSTHDLQQVRQAILDGASYLGVGPTFPSGTKQFSDFPGLAFVREVTAETTLPAFVLGGVSLATIDRAVAAGARRVAVGQAICQADDPRAIAQALRQAVEAAGSPR